MSKETNEEFFLRVLKNCPKATVRIWNEHQVNSDKLIADQHCYCKFKNYPNNYWDYLNDKPKQLALDLLKEIPELDIIGATEEYVDLLVNKQSFRNGLQVVLTELNVLSRYVDDNKLGRKLIELSWLLPTATGIVECPVEFFKYLKSQTWGIFNDDFLNAKIHNPIKLPTFVDSLKPLHNGYGEYVGTEALRFFLTPNEKCPFYSLAVEVLLNDDWPYQSVSTKDSCYIVAQLKHNSPWMVVPMANLKELREFIKDNHLPFHF